MRGGGGDLMSAVRGASRRGGARTQALTHLSKFKSAGYTTHLTAEYCRYATSSLRSDFGGGALGDQFWCQWGDDAKSLFRERCVRRWRRDTL
jgi:hypothetical protein